MQCDNPRVLPSPFSVLLGCPECPVMFYLLCALCLNPFPVSYGKTRRLEGEVELAGSQNPLTCSVGI